MDTSAENMVEVARDHRGRRRILVDRIDPGMEETQWICDCCGTWTPEEELQKNGKEKICRPCSYKEQVQAE